MSCSSVEEGKRGKQSSESGSLCHHQQSPAGLSVGARASSVNNSLSVSGVAPLAFSIHLQFKKKPGSVKGGE